MVETVLYPPDGDFNCLSPHAGIVICMRLLAACILIESLHWARPVASVTFCRASAVFFFAILVAISEALSEIAIAMAINQTVSNRQPIQLSNLNHIRLFYVEPIFADLLVRWIRSCDSIQNTFTKTDFVDFLALLVNLVIHINYVALAIVPSLAE